MKNIPYEQVLVFGNMQAEVFYKTPEWRRLRYLALQTLGPRCQMCGASAKLAPLHVDHIKPRFLSPETCLDLRNLQILCEDCHVAKTAQDVSNAQSILNMPQAQRMADVFRIERRHLVLEYRLIAGRREAEYLTEGVWATEKRHYKQWRSLIRFLHCYRITYAQAVALRVEEFYLMPLRHTRAQFKHVGANKGVDSFVFDIDGMPFPANLRELLPKDEVTV